MKKSILTILLLISISVIGKAQTIDTTFHAMTACKIQPFKANFNDIASVSYLGIRVLNDNLQNAATLSWSLMDSAGNVYYTGSAVITGSYYTAYANGTNLYPFSFIKYFNPQIIFQ